MGPPLKVSEMKKAFEAKGMEGREGKHHLMFSKLYPNGTHLKTRISRGTKEYGDGLLGLVAKQLALSIGDLRDLVECTLDADGWDQKVRARYPEEVDPPTGRR